MQKINTTPSNCVLLKDQIDIWEYSLTSQYENNLEILNNDEIERAKRFHFESHRQSFITAHATLRLIASRYLDVPPNALTFETNAYGKPYLISHPKLQFNLSHSGNTALLAIGQKYPIGIDIEYSSDRPYDGIADKLFSEDEIEAFHQVDPGLKTDAFFSIWSQKEAFIKACGMGLAYPTKDFSVAILPNHIQSILDEKNNTLWNMETWQPNKKAFAAICYSPNVKTVRYIEEIIG